MLASGTRATVCLIAARLRSGCQVEVESMNEAARSSGRFPAEVPKRQM